MIKPVQLVSDEMLKDVSLFVSPRFQCSCWDLLWPAIIITVKIEVISVFYINAMIKCSRTRLGQFISIPVPHWWLQVRC